MVIYDIIYILYIYIYQILCLVAWLDREPTKTTAKHHLARIRYNMWDEMCSPGRNKCYLCKKSPNPHWPMFFFLWSYINPSLWTTTNGKCSPEPAAWAEVMSPPQRRTRPLGRCDFFKWWKVHRGGKQNQGNHMKNGKNIDLEKKTGRKLEHHLKIMVLV